MLMKPLAVGEVEVNPGPQVLMENTNQILTEARNKEWERTEPEKETEKYQENYLKLIKL